MIEWFKEKYEGLLPVCAVLTIVGTAISGAIIGSEIGISFDAAGIMIVVGLALGIVVGILTCIFTFGLIGVILEMRDCLKKIADGQKQVVKNTQVETKSYYQQNTDSQSQTKTEEPKKEESKVWVCTKCGHTNPIGTMLCAKCNG